MKLLKYTGLCKSPGRRSKWFGGTLFSYDFGYYQKQMKRIFDVAHKIIQRKPGTPEATAIPDAEDLVIGTGRRIKATVMFLDVSRSSSRALNSETEQYDMLRLVNLYFTEMIRVIEEFDGTVEKNTGDGLMAYFVHTTDSNSCVAAIQASLAIFKAQSLFLDEIASTWNLAPLKFRICLDHGSITVARVGAARRFNGLVAIGTTANIAAKMLSSAAPDELLFGEDVIQHLPPNFLACTTEHITDTGWIYTAGPQPYRFFRYDCRFSTPPAP